MTGRLIGVVGPSGVGKDTVMAEIARRCSGVVVARRVITRAEDAGGEDFFEATDREFAEMAEAGAFALWWTAHGLSYGIPVEVNANLAEGRDVLVNLSRHILALAVEKFERFEVLSLTAPREVLATRLAKRGRETETQILSRLERVAPAMPEGISCAEFSNDRAIDAVVTEIMDHYFSDSGMRCSA
ncbi:phosphonate metabolism protein/1,5-bisphosphokinase (PRPP-forming) PhnN [Falsihalocynthiibacter sp. SS001]|uniref:phosphonate metabolism protein/1,5-bisphosphokinase (PRPP-forming) PhnN n=1 Tax=Falsihalocynthiibacter sp. SS001 TaxID=3349698 RepID=UPI0036D24965